MSCRKCGRPLNENGVCPVCSRPNPGKGMGIASMAVGIGSLATSYAGVGLIAAIIGLYLSNASTKASEAVGLDATAFAKTGHITSLISIFISSFAIISAILAAIAYFVIIVLLYGGMFSLAILSAYG